MAFELTGDDLVALYREASRRCPQGAEILRQGVSEQRFEPADSAWQQWSAASADWLDPPRRSAQLVVLCHVASVGSTLPVASARLAAPAPVSSGLVER